MSPQGHASLGPSSAYRWTECPASVRLSRQITPPPSGPAAVAGTTMHSAYERVLLGRGGLTADEVTVLEASGFSGERAQLIVDQAVLATRSLLDRYAVTHFVTETRVDPGRRIGRSDYWGTADLVAASAPSKTAVIGDLKTGRGPVDPVDNLQLLSYALGALDVLDFVPERLVLAIVQPPLHGAQPVVWETTPEVLVRFQAFIAERAAATDDPTVAPVPSEAACQWCPARSICPAHLHEGGAA